MPGIICREAKISDLKFIDGLSKGMYSGADYTPNMFPVWLCDENWQTYVAEMSSSGDVVGFLALHVVDNRSKVIIRSSRVAKEHRDKGIYARLLHYSLSDIKEKFSSVKFVMVGQALEVKTPQGYEFKHSFAYELVRCGANNDNPSHVECNCNLCIADIDNQLRKHDALTSLSITRESFSSLFETKKQIMRELFPRDMVNIEEALYRLDLKENRTFFDNHEHMVTNFSGNEDCKVMSIVDLFPRETVDGYNVYCVDLYGNNSAVILQHALKAIRLASEQEDGKVFDIYIQMHSKEAEAIVCHFHKSSIYNVIVRDEGLKISQAEIDIVISNTHKKFFNNGQNK
eukprot:gene6834-7602_t